MQKIYAYFKTESNALSAKATLETLKVEKTLVEQVTGPDRNMLMEFLEAIFADDDQDNHDPQLLHAEVMEEDFEEANKIVQESKGYISKEQVFK